VSVPESQPAPANASVYRTVHASFPTQAALKAWSAAPDSHPPSQVPHRPRDTPKLATSTLETVRPCSPHDSVTSSPSSAAAAHARATATVRNAARAGSPPASSKRTSVLGSPGRRKPRGTW
jgi:hypothetical protein